MPYKQPIYRILTSLLTALLFSACSSSIPPQIRDTPQNAPELAEAQQRSVELSGQTVRWGGNIQRIENRQNHSRLEIIAFPLDSNGRPQDTDQTLGRFIADVDHFLEPEIYTQGRQLTVLGRLQGTESHAIGEFSYNYPVVKAEHYYLWPVKQVVDHRDDWRYDPWWPYPYYYPGYPWYPWHSPRLYSPDK
jgi:outer membrane lipoprotein